MEPAVADAGLVLGERQQILAGRVVPLRLTLDQGEADQPPGRVKVLMELGRLPSKEPLLADAEAASEG